MKNFGKWYYDLLFVCGLICCAVIGLDRIFDFLNMFMKGMFTALSIFLPPAALFFHHNKRFQKKLTVEMNDERIGIITGKSASLTLTIMTFTLIVLSIVLGFFGEPFQYISLLLVTMMLAQVIIFYIIRVILAKIM